MTTSLFGKNLPQKEGLYWVAYGEAFRMGRPTVPMWPMIAVVTGEAPFLKVSACFSLTNLRAEEWDKGNLIWGPKVEPPSLSPEKMVKGLP